MEGDTELALKLIDFSNDLLTKKLIFDPREIDINGTLPRVKLIIINRN